MRVDGSDAEIDHFKLFAGKLLMKQDFQNPRRPNRWLRVAHRRRLSKNKDSAEASRLYRVNLESGGTPGKFWRKKTKSKLVVIDEKFLIATVVFDFEEIGIITITAQTQPNLNKPKQQQRQSHCRRAEQPFAPSREWRTRGFRNTPQADCGFDAPCHWSVVGCGHGIR